MRAEQPLILLINYQNPDGVTTWIINYSIASIGRQQWTSNRDNLPRPVMIEGRTGD